MDNEHLKPGQLEPGQSVLEAIEQANGRQSRVLLRDVPEEHSPLVRVTPTGSEDEVEDSHRYLMLGEIARGGVGIVFKGRDKDLGREVAVKMLLARFADKPEVVERFIEEAQITGQLHNPGIVPIYDIGLQPDGRPYFVMKLIKGRTLAALLEERADASAERRKFLSVFEQICRTIGYAHARGVIHRDLKPSNIMLGAFGEVQVVDWGFAKLLGLERRDDDGDDGEPAAPLDMSIISTVRTGEGSSQSIAGSVMGTPAYMPAEQALGMIDRLDERTDVFSLGAILCEILTGQPPYIGDPHDLLILAAQSKLDDAYARLDACEAHPDLVALARRCLQPLRSDRPADGKQIADGIAAHLAAVEERARQAEVDTAAERASQREEQARLEREAAAAQWERQARRRIVALAAVLLVAVALGGGGYALVQGDREAQAQRTLGAVREAEDDARLFEGQGRWAEAEAAAQRAVQLAMQPAIDAGTRERAESLRARLEEQRRAEAALVAEAARDAGFVDRLAEIQARGLRGRSADEALTAYASAFQGHDMSLDEQPRAVRSRIVRASMTALDEMELLFQDKRALRSRILYVDPDPWRTRVRELHYAGDVAGLDKLDAAGQPVASVALLGHALIAQRRWPKALAVLQAGYDRFPSDYRIIALLADACEAQKQWAPAARFLTTALALRPTSAALRNRLGLALARAGDLDAAMTTLQEGALQGLDMDGYCQLGHVLARKGDREAAVEAFREAMRKEPRSAHPHLQLGQALVLSFQDYEGAIAAYKDALRLEPKSPELHRALGEAYDGNGDPKRALEAIEQALKLQPGFAAARESRGIVYLGQRRYQDAIEDFLATAKLDEERASAWYWLARVYLESARYTSALSNLEAAQLRGFRVPDNDVLRGIANEGLGKTDAAIGAYARAIQIDRNDAEAHCRAGRVLFRSGNLSRGLQSTRRGHELGLALGEQWRYPSAEQLASQERQSGIEARLAAGKPEGEPSVDLAMVHFFAKRYDAATRVFKALDAVPAGEARLYAAAAALRSNAPAQARIWMQAEFAHWKPRLAAKDAVAYRTMMDWREGWLLQPVAAGNLDRLAEADRAEWKAFWARLDEAFAEVER